MHKIKLDYYWKPFYQFSLEQVQELVKLGRNRLRSWQILFKVRHLKYLTLRKYLLDIPQIIKRV